MSKATAPVAIIGTGKMATGLARRFVAANVPFVVGSREPTRAPSVGGAVQVTDLADACRQAEIVVLAVPYAAMVETIRSLGDVAGKILVDISNPITPDFMALTIGHTTSAAEEIQKLAPKAVVVKAFNTIFAQILDLDPKALPQKIQVFHSTDDENAGSKVAALITQIGYEPVHSGPLRNARYIEPIGELNIHLGFALGRGPLIAPVWITVS
ncbi:MAG: NAD(P)-binding domain-containing protein [Burkholderiales bacterium]|jgi:predicted dinucleotide-binding enzyme|nr:NAD(P)-binding domain-containing protein [Burkholderiales bacterium]